MKLGPADFAVALAYALVGVLVGALLAMPLWSASRTSGRRVVLVAVLCGAVVFTAALLAIGYENTGAP